jgi:hypothetical protein
MNMDFRLTSISGEQGFPVNKFDLFSRKSTLVCSVSSCVYVITRLDLVQITSTDFYFIFSAGLSHSAGHGVIRISRHIHGHVISGIIGEISESNYIKKCITPSPDPSI